MVTFAQFRLLEARHFAPGVNGDWGFITRDGNIKSGLEGPHKTHNALAKTLKLGRTDHQAVERGHSRYYVMHPEHNPHFSVQSPSSLSIETSHKHASKVIPHAISLMHQNKVHPKDVLYDVAHHEQRSRDNEPEHESMTHREFMRRYGSQ